jgi:hypothetical protein
VVAASEGLGCESCGCIRGVVGTVVVSFGFGRGDVAEGAEQAAVVEPVDPLEDGVLDRVGVAPGAEPLDDLGLEQADDGLGERVVERVPDRADRGQDLRVGEVFA